MKTIVFEKKQKRQSLICSRDGELNNFLTILELCINNFLSTLEYKNVELKAINFSGQTTVKYFMQTQHLWCYKDTTKVSSPSYIRNNY